MQECQRHPRESPAVMLLYPRASPERHMRVKECSILPCQFRAQPGRDGANYLDLEDIRVKAYCDQHRRYEGYVLRPSQVTAVYVSSCQISDLFDDGTDRFCMRFHCGLSRLSLWSRNVRSFNQAHYKLRHADISVLHGKLELPAVRKSSVITLWPLSPRAMCFGMLL